MSWDEQELIKQSKLGDQHSMEILFKQHVEAAVRLAYLITRNWATAEDAVQEAFVQAFRSMKTFKEGKPFKPWFTRIVVNKSKRVKQKLDMKDAGLEVEDVNPHKSFSPEDMALEKEQQDDLFSAINALDENHRLPLILKYLSGLSEAETAAILDLPTSTVKSRLYVARQRLREQLKRQEGGEFYED